MTLRTERPPVRARSGRRPLPPLIFLLVLAVAAVAVWWYVIRQDEPAGRRTGRRLRHAPRPLRRRSTPPRSRVRVFNATDIAGLATTVADALKARGFTVGEIANDPSGRKVTGVGEVRHGAARRSDAADFVRLFLPGAGDYPDTRADRDRRRRHRPRVHDAGHAGPGRGGARARRERCRRLLSRGLSGVELGQQVDERRRRSTAPRRSPSARRTGGRAAR